MLKTNIYRPSGALSEYVEYYWTLESEHTVNNAPTLVYPLGMPEMIFHYGVPFVVNQPDAAEVKHPQSLLCCQKLSSIHVSAPGITGMVAVTFKPYGCTAFFGFNMNDFVNKNIDLCGICGDKSLEINDRLASAKNNLERIAIVEKFLLSKLTIKKRELDIVKRGIEAFDRRFLTITVDDAAKETFVSYRQFERLFLKCVGLTPKQYLKIKKIDFAMNLITTRRKMSLTEIAMEAGFYDQSHLISNFKAIINDTPSSILKQISIA